MTQNEFDDAIKALADELISTNRKWVAGIAEALIKAEAADLDPQRCLSKVKKEAARVEAEAEAG